MTYASLSLDLDNKWSYLKTHGDAAWERLPSYLDVVVPRVLSFLRQRALRISFFIVGQDAAVAANRTLLQDIAGEGHEIASHSFAHDPWLHLYSDEQLETDLRNAEESIEQATGIRPVGFRGPGFSLSSATLRLLASRGYEYDATVFPNLLNPLARAYFFATSRLTPAERERRKALFGSWSEALKPVRPFRWDLGERRLLEVPVTTMPVMKLPFHLSYLIYLARFSRLAAAGYFAVALRLCRMTGSAPSILLHPLDFLGVEDCPDLSFFPGMTMPASWKLSVASEMIGSLISSYEIVTVREHARRAATLAQNIPLLRPGS